MSRLVGDGEDDLAKLASLLEVLVRLRGALEGEDSVDDRLRLAPRDQLVGALEILAGPHRRAVDRELLPPDPVELSRRVGPARRAADRNARGRSGSLQRRLPGVLADVLDDHVG